MKRTVIQGEKLSKRYAIGERERYLALRDVLARTLRAPLRTWRRQPREYLWALKDVSFEVREGEVVGLIGRNGAGKTTLLKLLARITRPTSGHAEVRGRVGSLLEVGTGFHPELTGRENIFLSGAILGMSKKEIEQKFGTIVAFAEVERFIDTPLKHYSSGMQMRLAFAVAAHLEPEILLVDEVLAVGDLQFQKKCLGKMQEVSSSGRTIIFVSHQMNQIRRLCERVLWIDAGRIHKAGATGLVLGEYEAAMSSGTWSGEEKADAPRTKARFVRWEIVEPRSDTPNLLTTLGPVTLRIVVRVSEPIRMGQHGIALFNSEGQLMWGWAADNLKLEAAVHEFLYAFPSLPLRPGAYSWQVSLWEDGKPADVWSCVPEMIIATEFHQHPRDEWSGVLNIPCKFAVVGSGESWEKSPLSLGHTPGR